MLLKDEERAYDAMQDVFLQVVRKQDKLNDKAPSSLLYTIATNICLNIIRRDKNKQFLSIDDTVFEIACSDNFEKRFVTSSFLDALFRQEKDTTRTIAVLHYVDRFTLEETSEMVGMSVSGIRKRLRSLREKGLALEEAAK